MSTLLPALRVKFGNMEYFISHMPVNDLVRQVVFPAELDEWENMSIDVKFQREINFGRVKKSIAPYFAHDKSRFSGAIVLAVKNHEHMDFEPLGKFNDIPKMYEKAAQNMGYLVLSGEEQLVPLDGQHRVKAFEFATTGMDQRGKPIPNLDANSELGKDSVAVIIIRYDTDTSRRIFSKINRYAKATGKGDNLITDDDDKIAVITRRLITEDGLMSARLVKLKGDSLNDATHEFTTLNTFYEATYEILRGLCVPGAGDPKKMTDKQMKVHSKSIRKEWEGLLSNIDMWKKALKDPSKAGDETRKKIRKESLLGKPIGQRCLVMAYSQAKQHTDLTNEALYARLNAVDWSVGNETWKNLIINPNGTMMSGPTVRSNTSKIIAYMIGIDLDESAKQQLLEQIYGSTSGHDMPSRVTGI